MRSGSTLRHTALKLAALALAALVIAGGVTASGRDEPRRRAEQRTFTDAEILDGFFKLAFGAEFRFGRRTERIRKYDGPVRVFVENRGQPDRQAQLAGIIVDIRTRMKDLDIAITRERSEANA